MKRTALALTLVLTVLSLAIAGALLVNPSHQAEIFLPPTLTASASSLSPTPEPTPAPEPKVFSTYWDAPPGAITQSPTIIILSPQDNETYSTDNIVLRVNVGSEFWVIDSVYYEADWREGIHRVNLLRPNYEWGLKTSITVNFTAVPDGSHSLTVYANVHNGSQGSSSVFFATDASPPKISVLSIENKTYYTADLPLNLTVNEPTSWVGYSLDGQENATISENITMQGLSYGIHSLIVYANDTVGNMGSSDIIVFSIAEPEPLPTLFIVAIVSFAVISIGLLIYFSRRKR